jgi:hypothetical protein
LQVQILGFDLQPLVVNIWSDVLQIPPYTHSIATPTRTTRSGIHTSGVSPHQ